MKIERAAADADLTPQQFADSVAPTFVEAWKRLNISNDDFIRTTEPRHRVAVQQLLQACYDAGDIELGLYRGKYCVPCELYYSDEDLLPGDLCPIHQRLVETVEEENYFFKLSRFEDRLLEWYDQHPDAIRSQYQGSGTAAEQPTEWAVHPAIERRLVHQQGPAPELCKNGPAQAADRRCRAGAFGGTLGRRCFGSSVESAHLNGRLTLARPAVHFLAARSPKTR